MTNGDVLRSMSDEQLAEQLVIHVDGLEPCRFFLSVPTGRMFVSRLAAIDVTANWLKQQEETDEHQ